MNLIVDIGNTRVKAAVFKEDSIEALFHFSKRKIVSEIKKILKTYKIEASILSSVSNLTKNKLEKLLQLSKFIQLTNETKVQFINLYETPQTLGVDRIALANAAVSEFPNQNVLIIDAGTCITYDFVTKESEYLGGAISPGIKMRYQALHEFTAKLPLLKTEAPKNFIGNNTVESMNSGVINGVVQEMQGVIKQYKKKYLHLTVVLTGGDTNFLSKQFKSSIFANQNFLLIGLNKILIFNKNK